MLDQWRAFIDTERWNFDGRDNNLYHVAFREVTAYRAFLGLIQGRYRTVGSEYMARSEAFSHRIREAAATAERIGPDPRLEDIQLMLRMEIESFYLFARILLDKVAFAVHFYFGLNQSGHSLLTKQLDKAGLPTSERLRTLAKDLGKQIGGFRSEQITHQKELRAIRATGYRTGEGPRVILSNLYPTDGDQQHESRPLEELIATIDNYLSEIMAFLVVNREQTALQRIGTTAPTLHPAAEPSV
jgi:hypothetical protein